MSKKKFLVFAAAVLALGFLAFAGVSYFFATQFVAPAQCAIGDAPQEFPFPIKNVSFTTGDGLAIKGWYSPDEKKPNRYYLVAWPSR